MNRIRLARNLLGSARLVARQPKVARMSPVDWTRAKSSLTTADAELAAALQHEINYETEAQEKEPEAVSAFLQKSGFSLVNADSMQDHVQLVKKFGTETVHVTFSMQDVVNSDELGYDEGLDESGQDGAESGKNEHESALDKTDEDTRDADTDADPYNYAAPASLNIVVQKSSGQALGIEAVLHDEGVTAEKLIPFADATVAMSRTPDADYVRSNTYFGPAVSSLDENVQVALEKYLAARGIDAQLAEFVYEYVSYRENKSYGRWLEEVKKVLEKQ